MIVPFSRITGSDRDVTLAQAYAVCDQMTRSHSKSFYFSTSFLPAPKRQAIRALYAFCRTTDDMVDEVQDLSAGTLDQWRIAARRPAVEQTHPVLLAWATAREKYHVPQRYAEELIDGCAMDLNRTRYATWDDLAHYCYCVASTVGLMSMHIIGVQRESRFDAAVEHATELGIALQLTNILRDVGEDLQRSRIYLPQEDLLRFDYTNDDLRKARVDVRFKKLMRFEMDRADELYDSGIGGIAFLNRDGRLAVGAAALLYRGILGKIHLNDYDVFSRRAHLSNREKIHRMPGIAFQIMRIGAAAA